MVENLENNVIRNYEKIFKSKPGIVISAPGRINLIGEHTDYSEGFVLPVAIDRYISIAFSPIDQPIIDIYALDFNEHAIIHFDKLDKSLKGWQSYIQAVVWSMAQVYGGLKGWKGVVSGNIPIGAGLSSSAALEVGLANALAGVNHLQLSHKESAIISRKAEIEWVGVNVGIMDQLISAAGRSGRALKLDCRTLEFEYIPIPSDIKFVILDTMTRRELTQSAYNKRHEEVNLAALLLGVSYLRDASLEILAEKRASLPIAIYRRAKHVISENLRVHDFSNAMMHANFTKVGELLYQSHISLRDDFEVSSLELNIIVELAKQHDHCLGARMMGAGFGGCALAICQAQDLSDFMKETYQSYLSETGIEPQIYEVHSSDGVRLTRNS